MSQRGGGGGGRGNRGGRRPDYGRGQPQSLPGGSTSGGGPVGRGRGGPAYRSPSSSYSNPPPPAPAPAIPAPIPAQPEALATEIQQRLVQPSAKPGMPPSSSKALVIPPRPGFGTRGEKCFVKANHFLVQLSDKDIHHYDVSISPEISMKKLNREIISELVKTYKESHLGRRIPAYDGMKSLYTAGALPFESKEFVINLKNNDNRGASSTKARRERKFTVTIKLAAKPDLYTLQLFLAKRHHDCPQEVIQALDVVLRAPQMLKESTVVVGRSFFSKDSGHKGNLGGGVDYWLGYYQSLRPAQMGLSLNIDLTARSFYEPVPVSEFIAKYLNLRDLNRPLSDQDRMKVKKALRGLKVEITHRDYAATYKVTGISREQLHRLKFPLDDKGTTMTVVQYFREKYNIILRNTSLPALQAGSEAKPVYLPMEVCRIVKGQRYTKKLNKRQVATLLKATCRRPRDRENDIGEVSRNCQFSRDAIVSSEFGIHVGERLTRVHARVLPPPQLKYHDSGRDKQVTPDMGAWNMIQKKMVNGGRVQSWGCVNFSSGVDERLQSEFVHQLLSMCVSKGMEFNPHPAFPMMYGRQIDKTLIDIHNKCRTLQLLIIILPDESGSYGKIKRICETELGIVSQCCQPEQVQRLNKQYMENVSLKMNVKVGGRNTVLVDAIQRRIPIVSERPTIIFGADVTHPSPGEDSSPSIAAVVASMDWPEVTKYRGLVSAQSHREEIIEDLFKTIEEPSGPKPAGMIRDLLRAFFKSTGQKPHRIIFYRDGVSEGQFNQVLLHEVNNIRKACNSIEEGYMPPITFVVVQKRHHTRLFPDEHTREKTDRSGNIKPGTVVDTEICHPTEFDFYLNSHAGIKGTSRPTHYHVLFDENNFSADALQVLTNNLCYTYARCTRSVSIVPPAYYAHLAAFRARYYIEGEFSDTASSVEGRTTVERTTAVRALPVIKDNVKDVMFYC